MRFSNVLEVIEKYVFFVWLLCSSDSILVKVLSAGIVLFLVGTFVYLWCKIAKEK